MKADNYHIVLIENSTIIVKLLIFQKKTIILTQQLALTALRLIACSANTVTTSTNRQCPMCQEILRITCWIDV